MSARSYRLRIGALPAPDDRRELLELVLAAASLEIDLQVLLTGDALELLWPQMDPAWQQVLDQRLARIMLQAPAGWAGTAPAGVEVLVGDQLPALPAQAVELWL